MAFRARVNDVDCSHGRHLPPPPPPLTARPTLGRNQAATLAAVRDSCAPFGRQHYSMFNVFDQCFIAVPLTHHSHALSLYLAHISLYFTMIYGQGFRFSYGRL